MKLIIATMALVISSNVMADNYIEGYARKDGTYVQPHYRSSPNSNSYDNYSSKGNSNPYNGNRGSVDAYQYKAPDNYQYQSPGYSYKYKGN